jgi:hypothetical protein
MSASANGEMLADNFNKAVIPTDPPPSKYFCDVSRDARADRGGCACEKEPGHARVGFGSVIVCVVSVLLLLPVTGLSVCLCVFLCAFLCHSAHRCT